MLGIARAAFADRCRLFNDGGSPKAITELDNDTALAIESVEVREQDSGAGDEVERRVPSRRVSATKTLEALRVLFILGRTRKRGRLALAAFVALG